MKNTTNYLGYILIEHDDAGLSLYTEAFLKYTHKFNIMLPSGVLSQDQRFFIMDWLNDTTHIDWQSLSVGQLRSMLYSGRVDIQNHSVGHLRCAVLETDTLVNRQALRVSLLSCTEFIKRMFGVEPIAFTPPYIGYSAWQEAYFNSWFKYWIGTLADAADWAANLNTFTLPQKLKAIAMLDETITTHGWTWLTDLLTHLETNKKLCVILTHDVLWENVPTFDRNINPQNYKTFMDYLAPMQAADHLVHFRDLPNL